MKKHKLVVYQEHTLGYINPEYPTSVFILATFPTKGSPNSDPLAHSFPLSRDGKDVRLAKAEDFEEYRIDITPYIRDEDSWEFDKTGLPVESLKNV
jgi:hypothetical protein